VDVTHKDTKWEEKGVNGGLWDTRIIQECRNRTSGLLDVEKQNLCHPIVGSEGSLLAEESHIQSMHSTTGREAAFVPSLTSLEHLSHTYLGGPI